MAYRADIEIAVRGAQELKRLQKEISATSKLVDRLNSYLENIGSGGVVRSINNLKSIVSDAANAFDKVALNTDEAVIAARKYVTATNELNAELRERAALLKTVNEEERKNRLARAGIRETTQYAGPIGPGPASPVNSLVGQKSPVAERVQRTIRARQDELDLQQALLRLEQKSAAELNKKVQSQEALVQGTREVLTLLEQQAQRQKFLAGASGKAIQGPLAGPGAMGFPVALPLSKAEQKGLETETKKQQILQRMVATRQQLAGLAENLQRLDQNSAVAIADAERNQRRLNAAKERELQISKQGALIAGRFSPIGGAENIPGSPAARAAASRRRREAASNAIIGGAFPLLFGQGLGASVGGGLGGAVGGAMGGSLGFGLSLVGTALGSAFDQVIISAQDFAKSLREGGDAAGYLENKLGYIDPTIKKQIANLQNSGQTAAAAELAFDQLAKTLGEDGARAFLEAGKNTDSLSRSLKVVVDRFVAAGFAANKYFEELKYGKGGSFTDFLPPQLRPTPAPQTPATTSAFKERSAELGRETEALRVQLELTSVSAKTELDRYVTLNRSVAQKEYENRLAEIAIQLKNKEINLEQNKQLITNANLQLSIKLGEIERSRIQEVQRRNQEAAQAAERAARERLQTLNRISGLEIELARETLTGGDIDIQRKAAYEGQIAALQQNLEQVQGRLNIEARILDIQLEQALATENISAKEQSLLESVYNQQRANLEGQYKIKYRALQLDIARLQVARDLAAAEGPRKLRDITQQRQTELGLLQGQLSNPFGGESLDTFNQQLDQAARRYETLVPLENELTDLQAERAKILSVASNQEIQDLDTRISNKTKEIQLQTTFLGQLDATEKALLRQKQLYEQYQPLAAAIGTAFTSSFNEIINGTATAQQALATFFQNVANTFLDMANTIIQKWIEMTILNTVLSLFPGGSVGGLEPRTATGNAAFMDRVFSLDLAGRAKGGPVSAGTPYMVGERGPELFVPSHSGSIVPNNALGGDNVNVVVNVDAKGTSVQGNDQTGNQLGRVISAAVQAELVKQKRPGGLLA